MIGPWHKVPAAAQYCGISPRKFREWVARGMIQGRRIDGTLYFAVEWLDELMKAGELPVNPVDQIVESTLKEIREEATAQ